MATNHVKTAYDKIISIIDTEYPRFKKKNRIFVRDVFKSRDFGPEDIIMIYPQADNLFEERTAGATSTARTDQFELALVYAKKFKTVDTDFDNLTAFGESLVALFSGSNRNLVNFWHYLEIPRVNYNQSDFTSLLPPDFPFDENEQTVWSGFIMDMVVHRGKYQ